MLLAATLLVKAHRGHLCKFLKWPLECVVDTTCCPHLTTSDFPIALAIFGSDSGAYI